METRWLYTTSENFPALREAAMDTCIIPMGCVEKHGLHLPLGQDNIQVSHIAWQASQLETVCVFPDFIFGDVPENYKNMPAGSISLSLDTEMLLLEQLCEQIERNGFRKIAVFNGHGGNKPWLNTFQRELMNRKHKFIFTIINIKLPVPHKMAEMILEQGRDCIPELNDADIDLVLKYHKENMKLGHAGMSETSFMMGISPESVHLDRLGIESGLSLELTKKYRDAKINIRDGGWGIDYPNAFSGHDPVGCNERIGKAAVRLETERLAEAIKLLKNDKNIELWFKDELNGYGM